MNKQQKILRIVSRIPRGKVMTYGQISKAGHIGSPRYVGQVLHRNADPVRIPCHRVVFRDGSLSTGYAFGGLKNQKEKLEKENVMFLGEKVDLSGSLHIPQE